MAILVALSIACKTPDRRLRDEAAVKPKPFEIAVVGAGLRSSRHPIAPADYALNRAQGRAMWDGANSSFYARHRPELSQYVRLEPYEDGDNEATAKRIAAELRGKPNVLAVIGHSTSATTRAAARLYADAGIPLVLPIATGPDVVLSKPLVNDEPPQLLSRQWRAKQRLRSCFRLPPVDVPFQAAAVYQTVRRWLGRAKGRKRCFLIGDVSANASAYSKPLFNAVERLLRDDLAGKAYIARPHPETPTDVPPLLLPKTVAESVQATRGIEVIVVAGYGSTLQELLSHLAELYPVIAEGTAIASRPRILVTDGGMIPDLDTLGFEVYVTFPVPPVEQCVPPSEMPTVAANDFRIYHKLVERSDAVSFQLFGYDAVSLIAAAVHRCESTELSRDCILQHLANVRTFHGACFLYSFADGENERPDYYVYRAEQDRVERAEGGSHVVWKHHATLPNASLEAVRTLLEESL